MVFIYNTYHRLALLLGSDYCDGIKGIGPVSAMEILHAFPEDDGLLQFKAFMDNPELFLKEWDEKIRQLGESDQSKKQEMIQRKKLMMKLVRMASVHLPLSISTMRYHPLFLNNYFSLILLLSNQKLLKNKITLPDDFLNPDVIGVQSILF